MNGKEKLTWILLYGQLSDGDIQKPNSNTDKYKITTVVSTLKEVSICGAVKEQMKKFGCAQKKSGKASPGSNNRIEI